MKLSREYQMGKSGAIFYKVEAKDSRLTEESLVRIATVFNISVNSLIVNAPELYGRSLHPSFLEAHF